MPDPEEQVTTTDETVKPAEQVPATTTADDEKKAQEEAERLEQETTEKKPWYKKRFDELTRKRYEAEQRAADERKIREEREAELKALKDAAGEKDEFKETRPKPKRDDFGIYDDEKYAEALVDWKIEQREAKATAKRMAEQAKADEENRRKQEKERERTFFEKRDSLIQAGEAKYKDDFTKTVQSIPAQILNQQMADILVDSQYGAEIAYHLGKNLQEAEAISKLNPIWMAKEIGKIEARLQAADKKTTTAPAPISTIKGKSSTSTELDPDKNLEEWVDARNRGEI
jgi:hypothetical protein